AVVLLVAGGFLAYAAQATGIGRSTAGYDVTASFRSAEGVSPGTDIRLAGVKIGTVTGLRLNPETYRADAVFTFQDGVSVPDDSSAVVASEGLLGGTYIEIMPGGSFDALIPGAEIIDTQGSVSLLQLLLQYVGGSSETAQ
ncbi:MAG: outer membrane lipid asymmetry maintenance protein MlaD, partial [Rhodobacterales bacterium]|nr:outer membrane lipid asymmetry maintenance protein MlaD [Rhodobacterales bacterium]